MYRAQLALVAFVSLFIGCQKDSGTNSPNLPPTYDTAISLTNPQAGQFNLYRLFIGSKYQAADGGVWNYLPDTLVVELVNDASGTGWMLKEYFTDGSAPTPAGVRQIVDKSKAILTPIKITTDSLVFLPTYTGCCNYSYLSTKDAQSLPFQHSTGTKLDILGWFTTAGPFMEGYTTGYIIDGTINGQTYPFLNVVYSNDQAIADGPSHAYIYDKNAGVVRTAWVNLFLGPSHGFDLIK
jgi:hypothetical protein